MRNLLYFAFACLLAGCTDAESTSLDQFADNGRVIAMSGAAAGAKNACFTCHGLDGDGNGAGSPRLAGLDAGYLERQLDAYVDGRRYHAQMRWISERLDADERKAVSYYYSRMNFRADDVAQAGRLRLYHDGDAGRGIQACAACHGDRGQGLGAANPPLAGQPTAYLADQLDQWSKSRRRNDPGDVMLRISQLLTASERRSLAHYASRLPGGPPNPEFREAYPATHRADPRNDALGPPLHVPESARVEQ